MKKILLFLCFFPFVSYSQMPDNSTSSAWASVEDLDQVELLNDMAFELLKISYDSSRIFADSAYQLARDQNRYEEMVKSLVTKGISHYYAGSHDLAIQQYLEALKLADSLKNPALRAKALNEIGVLNRKNGNLEKAETTFIEALRLSKESGDSAMIANSMNNLGVTYDILEQFELAMQLYRESAEIKKSLGDIYGLTFNLDNMGQTSAKMGMYEEGEAFFLEAARLRKELGDEIGYAITINNIGELYAMKDNPETALKFFQQALGAAEKLDYQDFRLHLYKMLSESYVKLNNYPLAYDYLTRSIGLKDSVFNERRNKQIAELQTRYETEKKEQELMVLKAESDLQAFQIRQARAVILGIAILALVIIAAIVLFNSRKHYKLQAQLAEKKKQLQQTRFKAVIDAEEKERKRIARELHDGLGQLLSTARLTVSSLDDEDEDPKIQNSLKLIDTALQEVRSISHNMMPNALTAYGLQTALEDLVRKINESGKLHVEMIKEVLIQFDDSTSVAVYRVVQEVFNNAIKYAQATKIEFSITENDSELIMTIKDNGKGFDTSLIQESSGIGWINMQSRMELIGGRLSIFSRIDHGTTVKLLIPTEQKKRSIAM